MINDKILKICQENFGNSIIENFKTNEFKVVTGKKTLSFNFSYISTSGKKNVMLRIINPTSLNDIDSLNIWYKNLYEKGNKKYATYGSDWLCLIVVFDGFNLVANILDNNRYYYTFKDINFLHENKNINNKADKKIIEDKCDFIYNDKISKLTYDKFHNNSSILELYMAEFEDRNVIGSVVTFCMNRNPISYYDAANMYFIYAEKNKSKLIKDRGLTKNEIIELSIRFCRRANEVQSFQNMTLNEAFHFLMYRIINQTFNGYYAEKQLAEIFFKEGYLVDKTEDFDINYGIDLIAKKNDEIIYVQVKSKRVLAYKNEKIIKEIIEKYNKALYDGYETLYAFYEYNEHNEIMWETNIENGTCLFNKNIFN